MSAQSPRPTDHEPSPGCTLGRRDFAKAVGMAAAIGAGGAASSGTVSAQTGSLVYSPVSPTLAGLAAAQGVASWVDSLSTDVTADETIMHGMAISEWESIQAHYTVFGNHLEDMQSTAVMDSRTAIAAAYEDGKSVSQAYNDAMSEVRDYYAQQQINHLEVLTKAFTQFSHITNTILASGEIDDNWLNVFPPDYYNLSNNAEMNDDMTHVKNVVSTDTVDVDYDLVNGETRTVETPEFLFETEEEGQLIEPLTQTVLDSYGNGEYEEDTFTFEFPDAGAEGIYLETDLSINTTSVDGELLSRTVLDPTIWIEYYEDIETQSDNVVSEYDEAFVQDLYDAMDDGTIDPSDVRGVEGQARNLSGTDDVTEDSYKMAMLQQLGMEQPDLSETASMTVQYTGYTTQTVERDDSGNRIIGMQDHVEDESYEGLFFGDSLPADGLQAGDSYAVGPTIYVADNGGELVGLGFGSGGRRLEHEADPSGDTVEATAATPSGDRVFSRIRLDELVAIDTSDNSELWRVATEDTTSSAAHDLAYDPESGIIIEGYWDGYHAYDAEDGENLWGSAGTEASGVAVSGTGVSYVTQGSDVLALDDTGSELWSYSAGESLNDVIAHSEEEVYAADATGTLHSIDSDGSEKWTASTGASDLEAVDVNLSGDTIYAASESDNTLFSVPADGSETTEVTDTFDLYETEICAYEDRIVVSGDSVALYDSDGNELWINESLDPAHAAAVKPSGSKGATAAGIMYDATEGEEIEVISGTLSIESMTDRDGNEVESTNWSEPEYDAYDATSYSEYVEKTEEYQLEKWSEGGGGVSIGGDVRDFLEDYGTIGAIAGAAGVVALFIALREFAKAYLPGK